MVGTKLLIRPLMESDINAVVEMQKHSFSRVSELGVVWEPEHLMGHLELFPEGQFCAVYEGKIVASASSLITNFRNDPLDLTHGSR